MSVRPRLPTTRLAARVLWIVLLAGSSAAGAACMPGGPCISIQRPSNPGTGGGGGASSSGTPRASPSAIEVATQQANALNEQGIAAYSRSDWSAAEALFRKSLDFRPDAPVVRKNLAYTQNQEGVAAYQAGHYTAALNYFQQALATVPAGDSGSQLIRDDLAAAQGKIDEAQRAQVQRQQDQVAAAAMQQSIQQFSQTLDAARPSGGPDFNDGTPGKNPDKSGGLAFMEADPPLRDAVADSERDRRGARRDPKANTCPFNTTCAPADGVAGEPAANSGGAASPTGSGARALDQARVAAGQGLLAQHSASDPGASAAARHPFDTPGGVAAPMPVAAGTPDPAPIPQRIRDMPAFLAMTAEKEQLQTRMNRLDSRLAEIRATQARSPVADQALLMEAARIKQDLSPLRGEMLLKQHRIDRFVVSMEEEPAPAPRAPRTPKETVPAPPHE